MSVWLIREDFLQYDHLYIFPVYTSTSEACS